MTAVPQDYDALRTALLALHRPGYELNGKWHDNLVYVGDEDLPADHVCRIGPGLDTCSPEEHYVPACNECRQCDEDANPGYLIWPCPTARLAGVSDASQPAPSGTYGTESAGKGDPAAVDGGVS